MYAITIEQNFVATHAVTMPDGQQEKPHHHDWRVRVAVSSHDLDQNNMAIDFIDLKKKLTSILRPISNKILEQLTDFPDSGATAELVAKYIHDSLTQLLPSRVHLDYTEVMEEHNCWARYRPDN
ncbi:queuosine biosynthesis protein QueD [Anaerohalosphaera lusitana]|uniref:6-carboxy-5,6,7,8-tetrahydropterin synthase n=1 Tax=Anaerohalosphaera lusitana TaxID=1936003 RepID=A0A1U9NGM1_9BACT|nr:6-carboxytetrahydropterin synthase [Anaerohalosphaera lusitana]AQT67079.1 queuosine biosynthesis protein QueD [Anaerohalosphaera lusitana]